MQISFIDPQSIHGNADAHNWHNNGSIDVSGPVRGKGGDGMAGDRGAIY